ncbi:hypothetical protein ACPPVO_59835 [Dactylosporangium sp. McL0621]|uniref:hypothetical protein n=1 Tax=Dactylosporangium sp. McL0621 TaxID=3415678 RepID=UPI003CE699C4
MDLREAMWKASEAPPPTAIDVDRLVAGERRRARGLRLAGFAAVVTVLAFGATMLPRYFGESLAPPVVAASGGRSASALATPRPAGSHSMSTTPPCQVTVGQGDPPRHPVTESCEQATSRLAATFGGNFQQELGNDWQAPRFVRTPAAAVAYLASWDYDVGGHPFHLNVYLYANPQAKAEWADYPCGSECRLETVNGMLVRISGGPQVMVSRPDGTEVVVDVESQEPGYVPPITEDQVLRLATAPEMTLYPTGS